MVLYSFYVGSPLLLYTPVFIDVIISADQYNDIYARWYMCLFESQNTSSIATQNSSHSLCFTLESRINSLVIGSHTDPFLLTLIQRWEEWMVGTCEIY